MMSKAVTDGIWDLGVERKVTVASLDDVNKKMGLSQRYVEVGNPIFLNHSPPPSSFSYFLFFVRAFSRHMLQRCRSPKNEEWIIDIDYLFVLYQKLGFSFNMNK